VLLMIQVHIIELFASETIYNSSAGKILLFLGGPPVAPLFMVVFGYFIAASRKTAGQLIVRGLKILALGMCLNIALNLNLIISVYRGLFQIDLLPYYFGVDILQLAAISIVVIALFKKVFEKNILFVLLGISISIFLGSWLNNFTPQTKTLQYLLSYIYRCSDWSYFPLFPWLTYPLSGFALYKLKQQNGFDRINKSISRIFKNTEAQRFPIQITVGALFVIYLFFTLRYAISIASDLPLYYHNDFIFALWTLVFLAFYGFMMNELNNFSGESIPLKYIKWLGKNVTFIYVLQWLMIGNTATAIYKTVNSPLQLGMYYFGVLIIASVMCSLLLLMKDRSFQKTVKAEIPRC